MKTQEIHKLFLQCNKVVIDTRKITKNDMFFALKGDNFDANTFAQQALEKGAKYVVIDNKDYFVNEKTILVKDSLVALQKLAACHRKYLDIPIIALTGSNGKTTTKELINVVLQKKFVTGATVGNLNNHIGVPLTLLSFNKNTQIGIVEMGANHLQEIAFLCNIAAPNYGYITNFGKAHLEGFGGIDGVIKGKSEMYDYLKSNKKKVFVNIDDPIQVQKSQQIESISFSIQNKTANFVINKVEANPLVSIFFDNMVINSKLIGLYNANNINAALTIGNYFGVNNLDLKDAIESYIPDNNRSQIIIKNQNEIILDAYNANPSSMVVALQNFFQLDKKNKVVVLGDMFELGNDSKTEHQMIVSLLNNKPNIKCYFVGKHFFDCKLNQPNFYFYQDFQSFTKTLKIDKLCSNSYILIKGSRGMALERTLDFL